MSSRSNLNLLVVGSSEPYASAPLRCGEDTLRLRARSESDSARASDPSPCSSLRAPSPARARAPIPSPDHPRAAAPACRNTPSAANRSRAVLRHDSHATVTPPRLPGPDRQGPGGEFGRPQPLAAAPPSAAGPFLGSPPPLVPGGAGREREPPLPAVLVGRGSRAARRGLTRPGRRHTSSDSAAAAAAAAGAAAGFHGLGGARSPAGSVAARRPRHHGGPTQRRLDTTEVDGFRVLRRRRFFREMMKPFSISERIWPSLL